MPTQLVSALERVMHDLMRTAAIRPSACALLYDEAGRPIEACGESEDARFEGRLYWNTSDAPRGFWAYRITPIERGRMQEDRAHDGPLVPSSAVRIAADRLRAVEDYARWYPGFAGGEAAPADHIWGIGQAPRAELAGLQTYATALRGCLLGLTRREQLAALALAGVPRLETAPQSGDRGAPESRARPRARAARPNQPQESAASPLCR